jgi:hypothetical protein
VRAQIHCPRRDFCKATLIYFQITLPGSSTVTPPYQRRRYMEQWSLLKFLLTNKKEVDCSAHHCVEYDCPEVAYEDLVVQGPGSLCKRWKVVLIITSLLRILKFFPQSKIGISHTLHAEPFAFLCFLQNLCFLRLLRCFFKQCLTLKKMLLIVPSPAGMSLTKISRAGNNLIIPCLGEFG